MPPLITITNKARQIVFPLLGLGWLSERISAGLRADEEEEGDGIQEWRGSLVEVEEAIQMKADLNAVVLTGRDDEYTLLHLTALNNHCDALQRLLLTGAIEVEKPTPSGGCTALFLAARSGHTNAAMLLLEVRSEHPRFA